MFISPPASGSEFSCLVGLAAVGTHPSEHSSQHPVMDKFSREYLHLRLTFINNESIRMMKHHEEKRRRPKIDSAEVAKVKRAIRFGPFDPEENDRSYEEQKKHLEEIEKARWNFDFKKEEPMEGAYKWSKELGKKPRLPAPKPRRPIQQKLKTYLPSKKSGESAQKKLKLMVEAKLESDKEKVQECN